MNIVIVSGNLTKDIESKAVGEHTVSTFGLAHNERVREHTNFFNVEAWNGLGTNAAKYISKGSKVLIKGRLKADQWDNDEGRQFKTTLVAEEIEFLDPPKNAKKKTTRRSPRK